MSSSAVSTSVTDSQPLLHKSKDLFLELRNAPISKSGSPVAQLFIIFGSGSIAPTGEGEPIQNVVIEKQGCPEVRCWYTPFHDSYDNCWGLFPNDCSVCMSWILKYAFSFQVKFYIFQNSCGAHEPVCFHGLLNADRQEYFWPESLGSCVWGHLYYTVATLKCNLCFEGFDILFPIFDQFSCPFCAGLITQQLRACKEITALDQTYTIQPRGVGGAWMNKKRGNFLF